MFCVTIIFTAFSDSVAANHVIIVFNNYDAVPVGLVLPKSRMSSTVDWADEVTTTFQAENSTPTMSSAARSDLLTYYKTTLIVFGVLGTLSNTVVLVGFWLSRRSRMTSSSVHILNHTTLEHLPFYLHTHIPCAVISISFT